LVRTATHRQLLRLCCMSALYRFGSTVRGCVTRYSAIPMLYRAIVLMRDSNPVKARSSRMPLSLLSAATAATGKASFYSQAHRIRVERNARGAAGARGSPRLGSHQRPRGRPSHGLELLLGDVLCGVPWPQQLLHCFARRLLHLPFRDVPMTPPSRRVPMAAPLPPGGNTGCDTGRGGFVAGPFPGLLPRRGRSRGCVGRL